MKNPFITAIFLWYYKGEFLLVVASWHSLLRNGIYFEKVIVENS